MFSQGWRSSFGPLIEHGEAVVFYQIHNLDKTVWLIANARHCAPHDDHPINGMLNHFELGSGL